jgi:hypothetical protein
MKSIFIGLAIIGPLVAPCFFGKSEITVLAFLATGVLTIAWMLGEVVKSFFDKRN